MRSAHAMFYADGYGVSIDALAQHAKVAKPTVYAHFASKEAILEAVLRRADDAWFGTLDAELARREGDPVERVMAPFDLLVADLPDPAYHGCLLINSAAASLAADHPAHRALTAHHTRMLAVFESLLADAGAAGPAPLARQLLLLYDGVKARGLIDHSGAAAQDARAAATALLTSALPA
ncbi:hypothetical protein Misp01_11690 [Microtetraspora sp. NBRC 13810]|nr:hypothetical protein Misp01_11690 [Microtetraspora sp. NBRC 13810]